MNKEATLYVIAAPSGGGKTSLVRELLQRVPGIKVSVSYTTRTARPADVEGVDYCFVSKEEFQRRVEHGDFLEHAEVHGNYYGTSASWVKQQVAAGTDVILEIDWQGVRQIKKLFPDAISIFIVPPSLKILEQRLVSRQQDHHEIIKKRLAVAQSEIAHYGEFDYLVVNDQFETAVADLIHIVSAARLRVRNQRVQEKELLEGLLKET